MAFEGCEFTFDGISSHEHGLVVYNLGNYSQEDTFQFPSSGEIVSDRLPWRTSSLLYTVVEEDVAEFVLVFGANPESMDERDPIDRWEQENIASWLTGHKTYRWLTIDQPDMHGFRFRCLISELESISLGGEQWAYRCRVTCDSPYAYTYPETTTFKVGRSSNVLYRCLTTSNNLYYPQMDIVMNGGTSIGITNETTGDSFELTGLPTSSYTIHVDNDGQVISSEELPDFNFYEHFNFGFIGLKRGDNNLSFTGSGTIKITSSFPVNIGG